jgi:hypothetical protein
MPEVGIEPAPNRWQEEELSRAPSPPDVTGLPTEATDLQAR